LKAAILRRTTLSGYPLPPLTDVYGATLFAKAAKDLGYHPFQNRHLMPLALTPTLMARSLARATSAAIATLWLLYVSKASPQQPFYRCAEKTEF